MTASHRHATIVFDLDGTLVDTAPDLLAAADNVFTQRNLKQTIPADQIKPWISYGARRMITEGLKIANETTTETEVDTMLDDFLVHYEANIANNSRPFPGILNALGVLRSRGCKLAVCTNKRETLTLALLEALNMTHHFDAIAARDTLSVCKPDPGHLFGAVEMAGGSPHHAVMIGDSSVDIETASAANVPSIGVTFGYSQVPIQQTNPTVVLDTYDNLINEIDALLSRTIDNVVTLK
ncbi:MAG: HAD hydrolase-like protein [Hyphomicrobiaceae bacterium]